MSTLVGRYASPGPHCQRCGSSEYFSASCCSADCDACAQAGATDKNGERKRGKRESANPAGYVTSPFKVTQPSSTEAALDE
jgi:hypothetical protein